MNVMLIGNRVFTDLSRCGHQGGTQCNMTDILIRRGEHHSNTEMHRDKATDN